MKKINPLKEKPRDVKLAHSLYFTCVDANTTKDDIRSAFETVLAEYNKPVKIFELHWDNAKKWGKVTLSTSEVIEDFLNDEFVEVNGRTLRCRAYMTSASSPDHKRDLQLQNDEEVSNQATAMASASRIFISEKQRPKSFEPGKKYKWAITITNKTNMSKRLVSVSNFIFSPEFKVGPFKGPKDIEPGESVEVAINFEPSLFGTTRTSIRVEFSILTKYYELTVTCASQEDMELTKPVAAYEPKIIDEVKRIIVPAFPATRKYRGHFHTNTDTPWVEKLPEYPVPENIQNDVNVKQMFSNLNPWYIKDTYQQRLHNLLYVEEAQNVKNIRQYDMIGIIIKQELNMIPDSVDTIPLSRITVPGLAEKRPSILRRDIIYVWVTGTADYEYEGWVEKVEQSDILVAFCENFHQKFPSNTRFNVRFSIPRMNWRNMHRAIDKADIKLLWPEAHIPVQVETIRMDQVSLRDRDLNSDQKGFLEKALNKTHGNAPLLLFGPFGTGKSRTLAELIGVLVQYRKAKVLVCTQSNSAADLFMERFQNVFKPDELLRLYAFNRSIGGISQNILKYSTWDNEKQVFDVPSVDKLVKYKVIVTTCLTAATLYGVGIGSNHFTHIIMDEAGQMMEPEALVPVCMASPSTSIILVGDDKQLGPVLQSPSAQHHHMDESVMERLIRTCKIVYNDKANTNTVSQFTINYRSHPKLLEFTSNAFYNGRLVAKAKKVEDLITWKELPNKNNFPCVFYGVEGEDMREGDSPSFFNQYEASTISNLIKSLFQQFSWLSQEDIGVISPYYKQSEKIRILLRKARLGGITVSNTEEFQGRERKVIFVSTVRSSRAYGEHDRKYNLGMLMNPKRMNTSLSRAMSLLVVVGDPYILCQDEHWKKFLKYCRDNKAYKGPGYEDADYIKQRQENDKVEVPEGPPVVNNKTEVEPEVIAEVKSEEIAPIVSNNNNNIQSSNNNNESPTVSRASVWFKQPTIESPKKSPQKSPEPVPVANISTKEEPIVPPQQQVPMPQQQQQFVPLPMGELFVPYAAPAPYFPMGFAPVPPYLPPGVFVPEELPGPDMREGAYDGSLGWQSLFQYHNMDLLLFENKFGYPPFSIHEKDNILTIKISIFNLKANINHREERIIIKLGPNKDLKDGTTIYNMGSLFNGSSVHSKGQLLILIPPNAKKNLVDIAKSNTVISIEIPF